MAPSRSRKSYFHSSKKRRAPVEGGTEGGPQKRVGPLSGDHGDMEGIGASPPLAAETPKNHLAGSFETMQGKLEPGLLNGVHAMGFKQMSEVQALVLNQLQPSFRSDCLVQAKTGTGKTAAFLLPALQSLLHSSFPIASGQVAILVLSPTRELATQIAKECNQLTAKLSKKIECHTAFGGTNRSSLLSKFLTGAPTVLVATPGRLKDYLGEEAPRKKLANIQTLVLDEADRMLDMGFVRDIAMILDKLPPKSSGWRGMCFSATFPPEVMKEVERVLEPGHLKLSAVDPNEPPTVARVPQFSVIYPTFDDTFTAIQSLLTLECQPNSKIIVFGVTAKMVALFADVYESQTPVKVYQMHSKMTQGARTRTTEEFKKASSGILFASDVVGRGMDFPNVDLVIQVGLPANGEQYVHRVGRTARASKDGRAIILLTKGESFFLERNPQLPIKPYPQAVDPKNHSNQIQQALSTVDDKVKKDAYKAFLGFYNNAKFLKGLHLTKAGLVTVANDLARAMGCRQPPEVEKLFIGRAGLKGVPGLRIAPPVQA